MTPRALPARLIRALASILVLASAAGLPGCSRDNPINSPYPSGSLAWDAFKTLHLSLKLRGLGVRQWTRDLTVPRETA